MHINYQHQLHHQDVEGLIHKQVAGQLQGNDNNFDEDDDDDDSDDSDHDDDEIAEIVANPWSAGNLAPRRDQCHISQNSLSYLVALSAPQNTPGGEITFNKLLHQAYIVLLLRNWIEIKPSLLNQITKLHRGQPVALV